MPNVCRLLAGAEGRPGPGEWTGQLAPGEASGSTWDSALSRSVLGPRPATLPTGRVRVCLSRTGRALLTGALPLQPHTHSLETLNLGHNPVGNEGVRNLKNGLIGNRSVLRLGLASTKLTCEGRARAGGRRGPGSGRPARPGLVASPCGPPPRRGGGGGVHRREPPPPQTGPPGERDQDGRAHGAVVGPQGEPLPAAPGPGP